MVRRLVELSGRPLSFTLLDISLYPGRWKTLLREVERANRDGLPIRGQVAARPVTVMYGLDLSFHPFSTFPGYRAAAAAQGRARLRDPAVRARLLAEEAVYGNPQMLAFMRSVANLFVLGDPPDCTPAAKHRLDARAATRHLAARAQRSSASRRHAGGEPGREQVNSHVPTWSP